MPGYLERSLLDLIPCPGSAQRVHIIKVSNIHITTRQVQFLSLIYIPIESSLNVRKLLSKLLAALKRGSKLPHPFPFL